MFRQNIKHIDPDNRIILNNLILDYVTSILNPNFVEGVDPIETKYMIIWEHVQWGDAVQTVINHKNEEFLSWHREYIAGLEQFLLDRGFPQFVPLPYWDPTEPIPSEFYDEFIDEYEDGLTTYTNPDGPAGSPFYLSPLDMTWVGRVSIDDDLCADFQTADALGKRLVADGIHSQVHWEMGGAMSSQSATAGTTAFWILHANLDRFYRCYQMEC